MSYGPDTDKLIKRIEESLTSGILDISRLNIHSLPPLPNAIKHIYCGFTQLTSLPPLPDGLQILWCYNTLLKSLPPLPAGLQVLNCYNTQLPQRNTNENIDLYISRIRNSQLEEISRKRIQERARLLKEELVAAVWHPRRVQRLLDLCGEDFDFEMI
jgi:hypothetical protein